MRKRWWILGAMAVATAALVVSGTVWWHSTADLDEVAARARAMGVPPTYEDIPNPEVADPAEVAALTAIEGLAEPLQADWLFSDDAGLDGDVHDRVGSRLGTPDPLVTMTVAHTGIAIRQLRAAVDALPDRPVRAGPTRDAVRMPRAWIGSGRSGVRGFQTWFRWGDDPVGDARRMTRIVEAMPHEFLIDHLVIISMRAMVVGTVLGRWQEIPPADPTVAEWQRWAEAPILDPGVLAREIRVFIQVYRDRSPWELGDGGSSATFWLTRSAGALAVRRGRTGALHAHLDLITDLGATTAVMARRSVIQAFDHRAAGSRSGWQQALLDPVGWNLRMTATAMEVIFRMEFRQRIQSALLVALVRGEPIPVDPTDPAGMPLRRYERNGELIGYYACGDDGVDNGGSREDLQFAFDRPWDPPAP
jgi:hypothetical protein